MASVRPDDSARTEAASRTAAWVAGTTPYAWPYDGRLDPARCALLIVDDGAALPRSAGPVSRQIQALVAMASQVGGLVVRVTTEVPDARRYSRVADAGLATARADVAIKAAGIDGFFGSPLDGVLRRYQRDQLLLTGHFLETSVHSTLRSANDRGYECLTIADACEPADPGTEAGALSSIEMSGGIFGAVGHTDAVLLALTAFVPQSSASIEESL